MYDKIHYNKNNNNNNKKGKENTIGLKKRSFKFHHEKKKIGKYYISKAIFVNFFEDWFSKTPLSRD